MNTQAEKHELYRQLTCGNCSGAFTTLIRAGRIPRYCAVRCRNREKGEKAKARRPKIATTVRTCIDCGSPFEPNKIGRPRVRCFVCSVRAPASKPGPRDASPRRYCRVCEECHVEFEAGMPWGRFCSKPCRHRARRKRLIQVCCLNCWRTVPRSTRGGDAKKYCSRECAFAHKTRISNEIMALRRIERNIKKWIVVKAREARKEARSAARRALLHRTCEICNAVFVGKNVSRNSLCSHACRAKFYRNTPHGRTALRKKARTRRWNDRELLGRDYIVRLLTKRSGLPAGALSPGLIEAKRAQIKLQRLIKEKAK